MTLDPEIAQYLLDRRRLPQPPPSTPEDFREGMRASFDLARPAELPAIESARDVEIPAEGASLRGRCYRPLNPRATAILYLHGGGWTAGGIDTHREVARALARDSGCPVVALEYRLAPEHPFPTPLLDCLAAWDWLHRAGRETVGPVDRVAVAGDSAGGNLCAALSLLARQRGALGPIAQLLVYPALDLTLATADASMREVGSGYGLTASEVRRLIGFYVPDEGSRSDPLVSPIRAANDARLPPTVVVTAGFDPLRDDGDAYASLLARAGAWVMHLRFGSLIHGFLDFAPLVPSAMRARTETFRAFGEFLRARESAD